MNKGMVYLIGGVVVLWMFARYKQVKSAAPTRMKTSSCPYICPCTGCVVGVNLPTTAIAGCNATQGNIVCF